MKNIDDNLKFWVDKKYWCRTSWCADFKLFKQKGNIKSSKEELINFSIYNTDRTKRLSYVNDALKNYYKDRLPRENLIEEINELLIKEETSV